MLLTIWLSIASIFSSPSPKTNLKPIHIQGEAQGTTYQLTYYAQNQSVSKWQIDSVLNKIDSSMSMYKRYSLISQFNNSEQGLKIDDHFVNVIKKSLEIYRKTDGLFDVTVQPLVQAWGFGPKKINHIPDSATIAALLKCIGSDQIKLQGHYLSKAKSCIKVDVNGIAQGYSVDVIAGFLLKKGLKNFVVEVGGEIRVSGKKPNGTRMNVAIQGLDDEDGGRPMTTIVQLKKGAITTSGNYEKYYMNGSKRISHLIDPRTGYSIENELVSVTVYAKDAITADGYDNALMAMGFKKATAFLKKQKHMEAYFIYHTTDGAIADTATAGFYKLIKNKP